MSSNNTSSLLVILNNLYDRPAPPPTGASGRPVTAGRQQIEANAQQCLDGSTQVVNSVAICLGKGHCQLSNNSKDGRGRPQKSMRVALANGTTEKRHFR